jgi:hypothetical protein
MRIVCEVKGGPYDGQQLSGVSNATRLMEMFAQSAYHLTNQGTIGQAFMIASPAFLIDHQESGEEARQHGHKPHKYKIVGRTELPDQVILRCEYLGPITQQSDMTGSAPTAHMASNAPQYQWQDGQPTCKECGQLMDQVAVGHIVNEPDKGAVMYECKNKHRRIFAEPK